MLSDDKDFNSMTSRELLELSFKLKTFGYLLAMKSIEKSELELTLTESSDSEINGSFTEVKLDAK